MYSTATLASCWSSHDLVGLPFHHYVVGSSTSKNPQGKSPGFMGDQEDIDIVCPGSSCRLLYRVQSLQVWP
jgi:hypothetical protein